MGQVHNFGPYNLIALPPDHRLSEYRIERVLGSGGFGITYSAIDEHLDLRVALKEYMPRHLAIRNADHSVTVATVEDEPEFQWGLDRFLEEARALARFDHPNIVKVKRFLEAIGTGYIVMEFVDGEPLSEMLKRKPTLTETEIRKHVLPLTAGLAKIHAEGLLHRDIKPSNIMVRADGVPALIDFGSARLAMGAKSQSLTAVITPGYAPLEQYSSSQGGQRSTTDIYALGAVLYRCVTGATPQDATDRALEDRLTPVAEAAGGVYSHGLLTAIDAALVMRVDGRPRDVVAFLKLVPGRNNKQTIADALGTAIAAHGRGEYELALREFRRLAELEVPNAQFRLGEMYYYGQGVTEEHAQAYHWFARAAEQGDVQAQKRLAAYYLASEDYVEAVKWLIRVAEQGRADVQFKLAEMYARGEGVPKDNAQAIKWYTRVAKQGDPEAHFRLGQMYATGMDVLDHVLHGEGMPKEHEKAVKWLSRAAEQGHAGAQDRLGLMYEIGIGVPEDYALAEQWYRRAAEQGFADAQYHLGSMYNSGMDVRQDHAQAIHWYTRAAEQRHVGAQYSLGLMYEDGWGVPHDQDQASYWYTRAAEQGDAHAQFKLGVIYEDVNNTEAIRYYTASAEQGHSDAQSRLGVIYRYGLYSLDGLTRDISRAKDWFELAAEQGDTDAQFELGLMYCGKGNSDYYGEGLTDLEFSLDDNVAVRWFTLAAKKGHPRAQFKLSQMYFDGNGVPRDSSQALDWLTHAADNGHVPAQLELARRYHSGQDVPNDHAQAVLWYTHAAERGNAHAQLNLSRMYSNGDGFPADMVKAYAWASLANAKGNASTERAVTLRDEIAAKLSQVQLAASQELSTELEARILEVQVRDVQSRLARFEVSVDRSRPVASQSTDSA